MIYINNPSIELIKGRSYSQHSILAFHKENTAWQNINFHWIFPTFMFSSLVILYNFGTLCIDVGYGQHYMSAFPIINLALNWWTILTFMLALLGIFFRWLIFIGALKIANILCYIILVSATFQFTLTNKSYFQHFC